MTNDDAPDIDSRLLDSLVSVDEAIRAGASATEVDALLQALKLNELSTARLGIEALATRSPNDSTIVDTPTHIGRFEVDRILGVGGFAIVYRAHDRCLDRVAAVKVPHPRTLSTPELRQRFVREARLAAQLDHPHIVPIFEADGESTVPYIAYSFCAGPTLAAWLARRQQPLPVPLIARNLRTLAEAIQYSHSKGILHRDLKPSNVLLFPQESPDETEFPFTPKLADFGLAKQTDTERDDTASGAMLGTPRYMAPEQVTASSSSIGPTVDVYGLGGILYELLTCRPAFTATAIWDLLTEVRECAPAAPRSIRPEVPSDLEVICLKCLAKDPVERYQSAGELADDLERFLDGRPIRARPASIAKRFWKWRQRHRLGAGFGIVLAAATALVVLGLVIHSSRVNQLGHDLRSNRARLDRTVKQLDVALNATSEAQQLANVQAQKLVNTRYASDIQAAAKAWNLGDVRTMTDLLKRYSVVSQGQADVREFTWFYLWGQQRAPELLRARHPAEQYSARFAPDGRTVAFAGADSVVRIYSLPAFRLVREIATNQKEVNGLVFGPQSDWLATAGDDGTIAKWDPRTGTRLATWQALQGHKVYQLAYSTRLDLGAACGDSPDIEVFDFSTGTSKGTVRVSHGEPIAAMTLSPDGIHLMTCGADGWIGIVNLETRVEEHAANGWDQRVTAGAWSPDGQRVAFATKLRRRLHSYRPEEGERPLVRREFFEFAQSLAVTSRGQLLMGDGAGTLSLFPETWQTTTEEIGRPLFQWTPHEDRIYGLDVSPDGSMVATASRDRSSSVLKLEVSSPLVTESPLGTRKIGCYRLSSGTDPYGYLYRPGPTHIHAFQGRVTTKPQRRFGNSNVYTTLALRGADLFAGSNDGNLYFWKNVGSLRKRPKAFVVFPGLGISKIVPLDDRRVFLQASARLALWDMESKASVTGAPIGEDVAVSQDGKLIAISTGTPRRLMLYDAKALTVLRSNNANRETIRAMTFTPSGRFLVTGSDDRVIRIIDVSTFEVTQQLSGHMWPLRLVAVSPDERTLASADMSGSVRLWDLRTGVELIVLHQHTAELATLEFASGGDVLWATDQRLNEFEWPARRILVN